MKVLYLDIFKQDTYLKYSLRLFVKNPELLEFDFWIKIQFQNLN
jgi:hypothetical protein